MRPLLVALLLFACTAAGAVERVVSLAPSLSEIMLDLDAGELLVGVLDGGERPAALTGVPSVGRYGQVEMETLIGLKPDLLLLWPGSVNAAQRAQLEGLGIAMFVAEPHSFDQLADTFARLGERIGRAEQGRRVQARFVDGIAELRRRYARAEPLRVFYQVWNPPLYTIGGGQIISDAIAVCGGRNVFADLALPAPQVSVESVLARDPQVIYGANAAQLEGWQVWAQLAAVRAGQLWSVPDNGLERPSLQMLQATAKLCRQMAEAQ